MFKTADRQLSHVTVKFTTCQDIDSLMAEVRSDRMGLRVLESVTIRQTRTVQFNSRLPKGFDTPEQLAYAIGE